MDKIEAQLDGARKSLLDLTMRNRLLNYRPSKVKTIQIADEVPREIYDRLVINNRTMEFLPRDEPEGDLPDEVAEASSTDAEDGAGAGLSEGERAELWSAPEEEQNRTDRQTDRYLETYLDIEGLQKRLFHISQQALTILEEQGYTALFLALGFLEWAEADQADQMRRAPLLLVPVEIERYKSRSSFKLKWTEEDIQFNISLQSRLSEQGVMLPEFEEGDKKEDIDRYFEKVRDIIKNHPDWSVVEDIVLDFFSFTKFVMYKDLDPFAWPEGMSPANHPLIRTLLGDGSSQTNGGGFEEKDIDAKLSSRDVFHVMDADPSQITAIEDIKAGHNLVVEGPPGTGKSQTITNVIAELLAAGKSVLFVSEKMAALEVVKSRLDKCGLGDFCLELHSRKAKKREVLQELERTLGTLTPGSVEVEKKMQRVEQLKGELNQYADALQKPFGASARSPFFMFYSKERALQHFDKVKRQLPRIALGDVGAIIQDQVSEAENRLRQLTEILSIVQPVEEHPWWGCNPGTILPADEPEIADLIRNCEQTLSEVASTLSDVCQQWALKMPQTVADLVRTTAGLGLLSQASAVESELLTNPAWDRTNPQAEKLINTLRKFQDERTEAMGRFSEPILEQNLDHWLTDYRALSLKFFRFFYSRYRQLNQEIKSLYNDPPEKDRALIARHLEQALGVQKLREEIRSEAPYGKSLFGSFWRDGESVVGDLQEFAEWVVPFRQAFNGGVFDKAVIELISRDNTGEKAQDSFNGLGDAWKAFVVAWEALCQRVGADQGVALNGSFGNPTIEALRDKIIVWRDNLSTIQRWSQFQSVCEVVDKTVAHLILDLVRKGDIVAEDLMACFQANYADDLLRLVFAERPELTNFVGDIHENKIQEFSDLDKELIGWNSHRLLSILFTNRPTISGGASPGSESGILLGEISRKRGHMPIRKLMSNVGGLVQKIKPCFMMSPLSIAQFLAPKTAKFDVIVFDEASQVKPEDALGAIMRGEQLVVMGDTRQLPPTSFFDNIVAADEEEDEEDQTATLADIESILAQCKRTFPSKLLNWHYRSRHESLIAVSNQEFYDNRLLIYPSAVDRSDNLGLEFIHVGDGIYDRGKSASNRIEARRVAEAAVEHYRNHPEKSLGIGTFNLKQQQTILEEIELQRRQNPDVDELFSSGREEHFFVKNLETIQGDERDVIFLSIGYGFDANKRLSRNFGPLNQEGGERRLNVLITRARERCMVFSNFRAADLSLDGSASFGLRALKTFLDYAETRNLVATEATGADSDSPFEDAVYEFLRDNRYEVRKQIGCAGFRVDLGVVDAREPGRYLVGIECDGAKYHSSPVARDRDRLRQQILEGLGWQIYRIWSTDWYRNRRETQDRLLRALEEMKLRAPMTPSTNNGVKPDNGVPAPVTTQVDIEDVLFDDALQHLAPEYINCSRLRISKDVSIHEKSIYELAQAVVDVVEVESPVHADEIIRRIRILWGVKRAGARIQSVIKQAIAVAEHKGEIEARGDFLWKAGQKLSVARRRTGDPAPNLEVICKEEIRMAIHMVLNHQHATLPDDLATQAARVVGFSRTTSGVASGIRKIVDDMIENGQLEVQSNGMVCLPSSLA